MMPPYTEIPPKSNTTAMRLTILINGPDPTVNHDYAVLWLDTQEQRWSREAHSGVDLPAWGEIVTRGSETVLCASTTVEPLCVLHDLHITRRNDVSRSDGLVSLAYDALKKTTWRWRLQAVDRAPVRAESALFAGEALNHLSTPSTRSQAISHNAPPVIIGTRREL